MSLNAYPAISLLNGAAVERSPSRVEIEAQKPQRRSCTVARADNRA
jgi:hypothetical protein